MGEMASHGTDDVLVAGDLVEGRWGRDDSRSGVFGRCAPRPSGCAPGGGRPRVYYPAYRQRFADHGLRTYTAVGDHEIGDDPWRTPTRPLDRLQAAPRPGVQAASTPTRC